MTQYRENFNLQIPYDHIYRCSLKIQSRSLKLYFKTAKVLRIIFVLLSLEEKKEIELAIEMLM